MSYKLSAMLEDRTANTLLMGVGVPLLENKKLLGFLLVGFVVVGFFVVGVSVSWFCFCWFLALVSWLLDFLVSWCLDCKDSWFLGLRDSMIPYHQKTIS